MRRKRSGRAAGRCRLRQFFRQASVFCRAWPGGCRCAACVSASAKRKRRKTRPASSALWGTCGHFGVVFSGGRRNSPEGAVRSFGGGKEKWKRASAWRSSGAGGRGAELRGWVGKFVRRGDGGVRGCGSAWCGRFGARRRGVPDAALNGASGAGRRGAKEGVPDAAKFGGAARSGRSGKGEREGRRERERERGVGHRLRRQGTSKAFGSGKRAPVTRFRLPCRGQKKALPESRQGLFDASETEITPCLRQCSRRCGRFPVLHRWE